MRGLFLVLSALVMVVGGAARAAPPGNINYYNAICDPYFATHCLQPLADGSIDVNATVSASVTGFEPSGDTATLSVTDSSGRVALPTGAVVIVQNLGADAVYVALGDGTVTAATTDLQLSSGSWIALTVGSNVDLAAIAATGDTATLTLVGGSGLATGAIGGGGGGSGGAVTIADGADVAEGATTDAAATAGGTGTVSGKLRLMTTQLGTLDTSLGIINTTLGSPMQNSGGSVTANAGTNLNTSALALESGGNLAAIASALAGTLTVDNAGTFAVQCTSGCGGSGGTSSAFSAAIPTDGTAVGFKNSSSGNMVPATVDNSTGGLNVNIVGGGGSGGTSSNFAATFPTAGTAVGASDGTNMQPLLVDGSGYLKVAQQGTVTVDNGGTFAVQAAQSGTWNINNVSGTVSLPTGAATAAKQPALGTAGTASADVITVQGIASMTPLLVDGTGGSFPISGTVTANAGTNLNTSLLALESGGNLAAIASSVAGTLATEGTGTAGTPAGGILTIQGATSMTPVVVSDGSGAMNVIVDSGTLTAVTSITNPVTVTDGAGALNVIVDSSALPSGAATESTLGSVLTSTNFAAAFGTAGTADSQVMSVQGIASMTPLLANPGTAANWGVGATASAVPANAGYIGANTGGNLTGLVACNSTVKYDASTSGSTELVALSSSQVVRVCGFNIIAGGTVNVKLVYGTGTNCGTGSTDITPAYQLTAQAGLVDHTPFWSGLATAASNALCINASGATAVQALVYYTKY